jgi:hypothetical protein
MRAGLALALLPLAAPAAAAGSGDASTIFALARNGNRLLSFSAAAPGTPLSTVLVSGLAPGERLVGIDFRPSTGELVGVSDGSRV